MRLEKRIQIAQNDPRTESFLGRQLRFLQKLFLHRFQGNPSRFSNSTSRRIFSAFSFTRQTRSSVSSGRISWWQPKQPTLEWISSPRSKKPMPGRWPIQRTRRNCGPGSSATGFPEPRTRPGRGRTAPGVLPVQEMDLEALPGQPAAFPSASVFRSWRMNIAKEKSRIYLRSENYELDNRGKGSVGCETYRVLEFRSAGRGGNCCRNGSAELPGGHG